MSGPAFLCPNFEDHTQSPEGYLQWHAWAEKMAKTHRQEKCGGCGLFAIWLPKASAPGVENECRVCSTPIRSAELCDDCAKGNDPFVTSKYAEARHD